MATYWTDTDGTRYLGDKYTTPVYTDDRGNVWKADSSGSAINANPDGAFIGIPAILNKQQKYISSVAPSSHADNEFYGVGIGSKGLGTYYLEDGSGGWGKGFRVIPHTDGFMDSPWDAVGLFGTMVGLGTSLLGTPGLTSGLSQQVGQTLGVSPTTANAITQGALSAGKTALSGGGAADIFKSGALSGFGNYTGNTVGSSLNGSVPDYIAKAAGSGAGAFVSSGGNPISALMGAGTAGLSAATSPFLTNVFGNGSAFTPTQSAFNSTSANGAGSNMSDEFSWDSFINGVDASNAGDTYSSYGPTNDEIMAMIGGTPSSSGSSGNWLSSLTSLGSSLLKNPALLSAGLGGLLGAASSPGNGTTTSTKDPWAAQQPYLLDLFAKAKAAAGASNPLQNKANANYSSMLSGPTTNPYLGLNNPYLNGVINTAQQDVVRGMQNSFDTAQRQSGSFGNSGLNESFARELPRQLGNLSNQMRYQDYANQQNLAENAVNRTANATSGTSNYQWNPILNYGRAITGDYGSSTSTPYFSNTAGNILGGALSGYQLYSDITGGNKKNGTA